MTGPPNTVFLRLEGPLQSWGAGSRFSIRATSREPTRSGVLGLLCCALGVRRDQSTEALAELNGLSMGVRVDRAGRILADYHTVGAGHGILSAGGKIKITQTTGEYETLLSRREYLCDASFLAALQGDPGLIARLAEALQHPRWCLYLGRKSCPPAGPVFAGCGHHDSLPSALSDQPWRPRLPDVDHRPARGASATDAVDLPGVIDLPPGEPLPPDAEFTPDWPISFRPPVHRARAVRRINLHGVPCGPPLQTRPPRPPRAHADYRSKQWHDISGKRLHRDVYLCVFCKMPAQDVHHASYRHAGEERVEELRSLCRLCHAAVTMVEYGRAMGVERVDPCEPRWREEILRCRQEIIQWRSEATRRRYLSGEED